MGAEPDYPRSLVTDDAFGRAVLAALRQRGELIILILRTHSGGGHDFFIVEDPREWRRVAALAGGRYGRSDRVEVYATGELPIRGAPDAETRRRALGVLAAENDVVLARRVMGDVELHDVEHAGSADEVAEWFGTVDAEALIVAGAHPFRQDGAYPFGNPAARDDVLVGYGPNERGEVSPGAY